MGGAEERGPGMTISRVHYDLTDLCNAGCPQCARTNPDGCKPREWLARRACSLDDFRRYSPPDFVAALKTVSFCGNYGDPAVVPDLIPILGYCWSCNPKLVVRVYSNASIRAVSWWRDLARAASGHTLRLIAAIDGTNQETSRLYRVGTDFPTIMRNTAAFISEGGIAEWWMVVFRHNEHQVETAEAMAKARGFANFRSYPSNRFNGKPSFTYSHRGVEHVLMPPTKVLAPRSATTHRVAVDEFAVTEIVISCEARRVSEAFIDFMGYLSPCCHIGRRVFMKERGVFPKGDDWIGDALETFDTRRMNIDEVGFAAARGAYDAFLDHLEAYWADQRPHVCKVVCGKKRPVEVA